LADTLEDAGLIPNQACFAGKSLLGRGECANFGINKKNYS
jgi:hypothetical protein